MPACRVERQLSGEDLVALPLAVLQIELAESGNRVRGSEHSGEADGPAARIFLPCDLSRPDLVKEALAQIIGESLSRHALHDRPEGVVADWLYVKTLPGSRSGGSMRNPRTGSPGSPASDLGHVSSR